MAEKALITRRFALLGAAASAAAITVPAAAAAAPDYEPLELAADRVSSIRPCLKDRKPDDIAVEVRGLARMIADRLRYLPPNYFNRVEIEPNSVAQTYTPEREVRRIERLIKRHEKAWLAFDASCPAADEMHHRFAGPVAVRENDRLCRIERRAFEALMEEPAWSGRARNRKATYLATTMHGRREPDEPSMSALIRSLL